MRTVALVVLAACGRIGFDATGEETCDEAVEPLAIVESADGVLCRGDIDVYSIAVAAGEEVEATLEVMGPGWPSLEFVDDRDDVRAVRTYELTNAGFADHDGVMFVRVAGVAAMAGTPYRLTVRKRGGRYLFIAPNGSDTGAGTFAEPWQRFDFALSHVVPGDTLVLLDGTYTVMQNGRFAVQCGMNAVNGTAAAPIRVAASSERRAHVLSDGVGASLLITDCGYWTLDGLRLENVDNMIATSSADGAGLLVLQATHVTVRRLLVHRNNRYVNSHMIEVLRSSDVLVEDVEVYDYHRNAIVVSDAQRATLRRTFTASRNGADIAGGYVSDDPVRGDVGLAAASTTETLFENTIDAASDLAFSIRADPTVDNVDARAKGTIAWGNDFNIISSLNDLGTQNNLRTSVENSVGLESRLYAFYKRSNMDATCTACTSIGTQDTGWVANELSTQPRVSSASCTNCLVVGGLSGYRSINQTGGWSVTSSNAFGTSMPFSPSSGPELVAPMQVDPQLGGCLVYLPEDSPMRGAGSNGADVGAQIVYRYRDGVLTGLPLWSPEDGSFPCGAVVAGINDDAATSCMGVHTRLHVGAADCPLPYPAL